MYPTLLCVCKVSHMKWCKGVSQLAQELLMVVLGSAGYQRPPQFTTKARAKDTAASPQGCGPVDCCTP